MIADASCERNVVGFGARPGLLQRVHGIPHKPERFQALYPLPTQLPFPVHLSLRFRIKIQATVGGTSFDPGRKKHDKDLVLLAEDKAGHAPIDSQTV